MSTFGNKMLEKLEFHKLILQIIPYAVSETGKEKIKSLKPLTKRSDIEAAQDETEDGLKLLVRKDGIPLAHFENVTPHLKRLSIGGVLNGQEIAQIARILGNARDLVRFFQSLEEEDEIDLLRIHHLVTYLEAIPGLLNSINQSVDESGRILDSASPELRQIRSKIQQVQADIRRVLNGMIKGNQAKYLTESLITVRNDRFVLPVKAENKKAFGGVVHDQSASGQTVYVEPQAVVDKNNTLRQLAVQEKQEEERILSSLSVLLADHAEEIENNLKIMTHLDFINAKAAFARDSKSHRPRLAQDRHVQLLQARHPLLDPSDVVPNDIEIGGRYSTVIVTGPNTGGKTVVLKTLGLLQMMGQAGLHLPASDQSQIAIFDGVYADIGDEQSIEQSLSTFSSHMTNIIDILEKMTNESLVLIDELGSGTDPQEGAALAIAIIEYIQERGATAMVSSHYPELKSYAFNQEGTVNASMTFDVDTLSPTFKLQIGVPGRSNAFEISQRLGIPSSIIDQSRQLLSDDSQSVDDMISDLDFQRQQAIEESDRLHDQYIEAFKLYRQLEAAYAELNQERDQLMEEAQKQADNKVAQAQEDAGKIIADIRQKQMDLGRTTVKEHELIEAQSQLDRLRSQEEKDLLAKNKHVKRAKKDASFQPGDSVDVLSFGQQGQLIEKVGNKDWMVQMGPLKMKVNQDQLQLLDKPDPATPKRRVSHQATKPRVGSELDIRGSRVEEGLEKLNQYLDAALLNNYETVTIIHGHGTGALRSAVHDQLSKHKGVDSYRLAPANQGGTGATIVQLKGN